MEDVVLAPLLVIEDELHGDMGAARPFRVGDRAAIARQITRISAHAPSPLQHRSRGSRGRRPGSSARTACPQATAIDPGGWPALGVARGSSTTRSANLPDSRPPISSSKSQPLGIAARRQMEELERRWPVAGQHLHLVGLAQRRQHGIAGAAADIRGQRDAHRPLRLRPHATWPSGRSRGSCWMSGNGRPTDPDSRSRAHSLSDEMDAMGEQAARCRAARSAHRPSV